MIFLSKDFESSHVASEFSVIYKGNNVPGFLATGMASPVMSDSSHVEDPSTTLASTGIFSPGTTCSTNFNHDNVITIPMTE